MRVLQGCSQSWCSECRHAAFVRAVFPSPNPRQAFLEGVQASISSCPLPQQNMAKTGRAPLRPLLPLQ